MQLLALEDNIPYMILEEVSAFYKKTPQELLKCSIYQILLMFLAGRRSENKIFILLEMIKPWLQPELYAKLIETERNKRVNIDFEFFLNGGKVAR